MSEDSHNMNSLQLCFIFHSYVMLISFGTLKNKFSSNNALKLESSFPCWKLETFYIQLSMLSLTCNKDTKGTCSERFFWILPCRSHCIHRFSQLDNFLRCRQQTHLKTLKCLKARVPTRLIPAKVWLRTFLMSFHNKRFTNLHYCEYAETF